MIRFRNLLPIVAVLVGVVVLGTPASVQAAFQIRATEFDSVGKVDKTVTGSDPGVPGDTFTFSTGLIDFSVAVVTNSSDTGPGFSAHSTTISITVKKAGNAGGKLFIEVLGDSYGNPITPALSQLSSNASPSSSGLAFTSVTMTSGVIPLNVALSTPPLVGSSGYTGLGGQLGMTSATGSMVANASSTLSPDPAKNGGTFVIPNPYTFYQTYTFAGNTASAAKALSGSMSAGSEVDAVVPEPASFLLVLAGLPILGAYNWLRRRKTVQMA